MNPYQQARCDVRDRDGHRCRRRGKHRGHRAFGHNWRGRSEQRRVIAPKSSPGWSRAGMSAGTRAQIRAGEVPTWP